MSEPDAERESVEKKVLHAMRQWALLTKLGFFVDENGRRVHPSPDDVGTEADMWLCTAKCVARALIDIAASKDG